MKITFDSLEKKFTKREKAFGKKTTPLYFEEVVCFTHREKNHSQDSSSRGGRRGRGRRNFRGRGGRQTQSEKSDLHCIHCNKYWHDASTCKLPWERIEQKINQENGKTHDRDKGKALESAHYVLAHCNIEVIEDLFNASLTCWRNVWLLDSGATCHMNFRKYFFEEFTDKVDGVVYFAYKSKLKPLVLGKIGRAHV